MSPTPAFSRVGTDVVLGVGVVDSERGALVLLVVLPAPLRRPPARHHLLPPHHERLHRGRVLHPGAPAEGGSVRRGHDQAVLRSRGSAGEDE